MIESAPTSPLCFTRAVPDDDAAIRRLLRENPTAGAISLSFEREPGYFIGGAVAGATDVTILAYEHGNLLGMGRRTTRDAYLEGAVRRVAYLSELRLDHTAANRVALLRGGYNCFHELQVATPADFTLTSIAADNHRALRLLERGLPGFPTYTSLSEYVTLVIPVPRRPAPGTLAIIPAALSHLPDLVALLNSHGSCHSLAPAWTAERLQALSAHGLHLNHFALAYRNSHLVAATALWDQRAFRQTVIRCYEPSLAAARPVLNFLAQLFGTPRLPAVGSTLAHACLSPLALAAGEDGLLPDLVAAVLPVARARNLEYLTLGLVATDPRLPLLEKRFRPRRYLSRLYRVTWPDDPHPARPFPAVALWPEVALL